MHSLASVRKGNRFGAPSERTRLGVIAIAFVTISSVLALEASGTAGILSVAFQAFAVPPAAAGRIVLAAFSVGFADLAVF